MVIYCQTCGGQDFYVRDARHFCQRCNQESAEHGIEAIVEDIGQFGDGASQLKKKRVGKKRRRRRLEAQQLYRVCFTTTDALTFVLKAWIGELIELGAKPTLRPLVLTLWSNYLRSLDVAFVPKGQEPTCGPEPAYRDLQVKVMQRKKILNGNEVAVLKRNRSKVLEKRREVEYEEDDMSQEAMRHRRKMRRKFLDTMSEGDESSVCSTSMAANNSLLEQSMFSDSFMSGASSGNESGSFMSGGTSFLQSDSGGDVSSSSWASGVSSDQSFHSDAEWQAEAEREEEERDRHAQVLERLRACSSGHRSNGQNRLITAFACLCAGVLLNEDNTFTLSDLDFWTQTGAVSYLTAVKNIPSVMKLRGAAEYTRFMAERRPGRRRLQVEVFDFCVRLKLGDVNFDAYLSGGLVQATLKRYLKEHCLPAKLCRVIVACVGKGTDLLELKQTLPEKAARREDVVRPLLSAELRTIGLIVFALKYLYGLDDQSEEYVSSSARAHNAGNASKKMFVFCDWLKLVRRRAFLAARHSPVLHERLGPGLFPGVELASAAMEGMISYQERLTKERRANVLSGRDPHKKDVYEQLERELATSFAEDMDEDGAKWPGPAFDDTTLSGSLRPLRTFSKWMAENGGGASDDDRRQLRDLHEMHKSCVNLRQAHSEAEAVEAAPPRQRGIINLIRKREGHGPELAYFVPSYDPRRPGTKSEHARPYLLAGPRYWRLLPRYADKGFSADQHLRGQQERLRGWLPENFFWLVEYFGACTGLLASEICAEVVAVEQAIWRVDPNFFGRPVRFGQDGPAVVDVEKVDVSQAAAGAKD